MPKLGELLDRSRRTTAAFFLVVPQAISVIASVALLLFLVQSSKSPVALELQLLAFIALIACTIVGTACYQTESVLIGSDLVSELFSTRSLSMVNAWIRRIDLTTEGVAPVIAGAAIAWFPIESGVFSGLPGIATFHLFTLALELATILIILRRYKLEGYRSHPSRTSFHEPTSWRKRWQLLMRQPALPSILAFSMIHLNVMSVLSVVGTSFLRNGWHVSEAVLGVYRGSGALCSLFATAFTALVIGCHGLVTATAVFLVLQAGGVILAAFSFGPDLRIAFLAFVVASRFGHSGLILCELQLRQETVPCPILGVVNGSAMSLNSGVAVLLLALGSILSDPKDFSLLVVASASAVTLAALVVTTWALRRQGSPLSAATVQPQQPASPTIVRSEVSRGG
jgi:iron-regulated transporter 1